MKKIDLPYNTFPKKDISLRKCTQKIYFRLRRKKKFKEFFAPAVLYRCDPGGGLYNFWILGFWDSVLLPLYLRLPHTHNSFSWSQHEPQKTFVNPRLGATSSFFWFCGRNKIGLKPPTFKPRALPTAACPLPQVAVSGQVTGPRGDGTYSDDIEYGGTAQHLGQSFHKGVDPSPARAPWSLPTLAPRMCQDLCHKKRFADFRHAPLLP